MIEVRQLNVVSGAFRLVDVSLQLEPRESVVLMGPNGAGKTTLLEAICGLRRITAGSIHLNDRDVTLEPPAARAIGYVPQDVALFTTMSVRDNLAYGLKVRRVAEDTLNERVREVAQALRIVGLLERSPSRLSGGEARRVAIGRAIAFEPEVVLLDEPLAGLDEATRDEVCIALEAMRQATGAAVLHVTHEPRDAERLADRVLRLESGQVRHDERFVASGAAGSDRQPRLAKHPR
ncbi:Maltose/maltodextrin import ATP-binding protein MalK [Botrimarina colliarenosi]|uniref:Maltose/maltodextrin import ATP-binding protein MalK n=1 Tax=Botrimarina colliarenosi TaxID=2528001 RepID=A0A5C6AI87_9BACT|nr:ATP-binding cassette domain-containing protein [Botrimarina colliarenosi]TWT97953.1 Maltose/maltodextrin import ATP-binding protein MalK [Botrimarina colliarenosi]